MPKLSIKTTINYSPNFDLKKRKLSQIKFIIFHYTGMKKETDANNNETKTIVKINKKTNGLKMERLFHLLQFQGLRLNIS